MLRWQEHGLCHQTEHLGFLHVGHVRYNLHRLPHTQTHPFQYPGWGLITFITTQISDGSWREFTTFPGSGSPFRKSEASCQPRLKAVLTWLCFGKPYLFHTRGQTARQQYLFSWALPWTEPLSSLILLIKHKWDENFLEITSLCGFLRSHHSANRRRKKTFCYVQWGCLNGSPLDLNFSTNHSLSALSVIW
jgi:hypothetical protein